MSRQVNVLHLSDLHYRANHDEDGQNLILEAFKKDLSKISDSHLKPDLVIFSGDLVHAADDADIYLYLHDELLEKVSKLTGCAGTRFVFCPGNHDAHRKTISSNLGFQSRLSSSLSKRDDLNKAYHSSRELTGYVQAKFQKFNELRNFIGASAIHEDAFSSVYRFDDLETDVVVVNTAWATWGGILEEKKDERNLLVPEAAFNKALAISNKNYRKILVGHHPTTWLSEECENDFINVTNGNVDIHLYGHMHSPDPKTIVRTKGSCLSHQSGAIYCGRDWYNGYGLVSYDTQTGFSSVHMRTYFPRRNEFDVATDIIAKGTFYSSKEAEGFWYSVRKKVDKVEIKSWISRELYPAAEAAYNEGLTDRKLKDLFVPPPMYTSCETKEVGTGKVIEKTENIIQYDDIVTSKDSFLVKGGQEYGKTSLLKQLALSILEKSIEGTLLSLPIYIDFQDIPSGVNGLMRALNGGLLADPQGFSLSEALSEGLVTILIDDVGFSAPKQVALLSNFISKHPRNRYIFTTHEDVATSSIALGSEIVADMGLSIPFKHIFLKPFTRKKMRKFVEKWSNDCGANTETTLNHLVSEFSNINIPVTAANGTILMTILDQKSGYTAINRATLIERFIEQLFEKASIHETKRQTFDFANKVHLLAYIAAHMSENDVYTLEKRDALNLIQGYLDKIGLSEDAEQILQTFISSKVLRSKADRQIAFRYRAFLEFFIAYQMKVDANYKQWVLDDKRYLSYINEIQYYVGLERYDATVLDLVGRRFELITKQVIDSMDWDPSLEKLEAFVPPGINSTEGIDTSFQKQMDAPPLTSDERDEVLEGELPRDAENRQDVFRPIINDIPERWISGLLLYSGVLKNLEIIPDTVKRAHLGTILRAWALFTAQSLYIVPILAKERKVRINGVTYYVNMPLSFSEAQVARNLYFELPNSVSRVLGYVLATEKLKKQLREPCLDEYSEPKIVAYYRNMLLADMRLDGWTELLETEAKNLQESSYFLEILARKIAEICYIGGLEHKDEKSLRQTAAALIAQIRGTSHKSRQEIKAQQMQFMERRDLLRRLKISSGND